MSATNIPKSTWDSLNSRCSKEGGKLYSSGEICKSSDGLPVQWARIPGDAWLAVSDSTNEWIQIGTEKTPHPACGSYTKLYNPPEWGMSGTFEGTYYACNIPVKPASISVQTTTQSSPNSPVAGVEVTPPKPPTDVDRAVAAQAEKEAMDKAQKAAAAQAEKEATANAQKAAAAQAADKEKKETASAATTSLGLTIGIILLCLVICCILLIAAYYYFGMAVSKGADSTLNFVKKGVNDAAGLLNRQLLKI